MFSFENIFRKLPLSLFVTLTHKIEGRAREGSDEAVENGKQED